MLYVKFWNYSLFNPYSKMKYVKVIFSVDL